MSEIVDIERLEECILPRCLTNEELLEVLTCIPVDLDETYKEAYVIWDGEEEKKAIMDIYGKELKYLSWQINAKYNKEDVVIQKLEKASNGKVFLNQWWPEEWDLAKMRVTAFM